MFNTSFGGNIPGYGNFSVRFGQTLNFFGPQGFPYGSVYSMSNPWQLGASKNIGYSFQNVRNPSHSEWNSQDPMHLPFLTTLHFPDLSKLMNDPIRYNLEWPRVPTKLPSDIPKFKENSGEDPIDHITTFHLWCSSNSLIDNSIKLTLFQCNFTRNVVKWHIELNGGTCASFGELDTMFLNHF